MRHQWIVYFGFWQQQLREITHIACGLTLLTSCLTGNTLLSLRPALPVPYVCMHTLTHRHTPTLFNSITTNSARQLSYEHHTTLNHFIIQSV